MPDNRLVLMVVEPLPSGDWFSQAQSVLENANYSVEKRRSELLAWNKKLHHGNWTFSDAHSLRRIWLAPRRSAIGITPKRIYFKDSSTEIDSTPEYILFSEGKSPEKAAAQKIIESQWELIQILQRGLDSSPLPVAIDPVDFDLVKARSVKIGTEVCYPPYKLKELYTRYSFDQIPSNFTVTVCPLESVSNQTVIRFMERIEQVARKRQAILKIKKTNVEAVSRRLNEISDSGDKVREGYSVLFILPGKKQKPNHETLALFERLREQGVPFRRAYADDPLQHSIPDQLPSLLIASGGRPHRSQTLVAGKPVWTIGVDISHNPGNTASVLEMTLVDPDGSLAGAWTKEQPRDETARVESTKCLLEFCQRKLSTFETDPRIIVIRDGRMFENEDSRLYQKIMGSNLSLFEFRKRGNPQIVNLEDHQVLVAQNQAAIIPGSNTMFIHTCPSRGDRILPKVFKITWRKEWNQLKLKPAQIATLLATSAVAPGLGLHPRNLPASVYWADGIAGVSPDDLRFAGVPFVRVK